MRHWEVKNLVPLSPFSDTIVVEYTDDDTGIIVADVWTGITDAQLIAAAPELLERLKSVVEELEEFASFYGTRNAKALVQAKALIARLEGDTDA